MALPAVTSNVVFEQGLSNFSFSLYNTVEKSGNEFISPYSISAALLLLMLGTDGTTSNQLMSAIFKGEQPPDVHNGYKILNDKLTQKTNTGMTLSIANRLFGSQIFTLLDKYKIDALKYYGSEIELLDFAGKAEQSRQYINNWISRQTRNKIRDIIPVGSLDANTIVVIANAIYFKGTWKTKFEQKNTRKRNFFLSGRGQKQVDMMHGQFVTRSGESNQLKCKVLQLPYLGDKLSMILVLPNDRNTLPWVENQLTSEKFESLLSSLRKQETIIQIPKFIVEANYDLIPILKRLGITEIFDDSISDFTRMVTPNIKRVYVSDARHKTYIEVNEEGSEAAAATTIVVSTRSGSVKPRQPFQFIADHPFMFLIRDNETGTILFSGRYTNP